MEESVFTRIIKGDIPCHKVYEDQNTIAFMDIHPVLPGHVLVVPKVQIDHVDDLPADMYAALFDAVKKVSKSLKKALCAKRAIVLVMGYDVPHAHIHVMPANTAREFYEVMSRIDEVTNKEPDHAELAALAEKIRES